MCAPAEGKVRGLGGGNELESAALGHDTQQYDKYVPKVCRGINLKNRQNSSPKYLKLCNTTNKMYMYKICIPHVIKYILYTCIFLFYYISLNIPSTI